MGGRTGTRRGHRLLAGAILTIVSTTGVACRDDRDNPTSSTADVPTTDTTIPVLTPDAIPVLRAVAVVPAGTEARDALEADLIEPTTVTRADFPADGVVTIELIDGRTAADDIPAGAILRLSMFTDGGTQNATTPAGAGVVSD